MEFEAQILGSGAIGSLFGYFLLKAGVDVAFIARGKRYQELRKGLKIRGLEEFYSKVEVFNTPVKSWLTVVCVKSYDTESAVKELKGKTTIALSVQNGIGNEEVIARYVKNVAGGTTSYAANIREDTVIYAGEGETWIGSWPEGLSLEVKEVAKKFRKGGMNVQTTDRIFEMKWKKAAINAVINPITALTGIRNGEVMRLWNLAKIVCNECKLVLKSMGIEMDVENEVRRVVEKTADNVSSMLQDVRRGKKTEIDAITGKVVEVGKKAGIDVRANETLYWLVKGVEREHS